MRILLIGGSGYIGSNLVKHFLSANLSVIVLDRKEANFNNLIEIEDLIDVYKGNYFDKEILINIFQKNNIDIVVNLVSATQPNSMFESQSELFFNEMKANSDLIKIMSEHKIEKYVYFSSGGTVYGNNGAQINSENNITKPISFYGWIKASIESLINVQSNLYGIKSLILRPSNPYGNNQNIFGNQGLIAVLFGKIVKNEQLDIWGDGNSIRDYIHVDDLCRYIVLLIQNECWNNTYNIGSGHGFSINNIIEVIEDITNKVINKQYIKKRGVDVDVNVLDVSKVIEATNFTGIKSLKEGISQTWEIIEGKYLNDYK